MSLVIFSILVVGLPIAGFIISFLAIQRILESAFEDVRTDSIDQNKNRSFLRPKINIFKVFPFVGVVFGAMLLQLYLVSESTLPADIEEKILLSVGLGFGLSVFFMCIGMAVIYREAIPKIIEDQCKFGKYLVLTSLSITTGIYGLLSSILLFMGVGLLGGEPITNITIDDANSIFYRFVFFGLLSSFTILKGYLPTTVKGDIIPIDFEELEKKRKQGLGSSNQMDYTPDPVFTKKMVFGVIPEFPIIIGLFFIILDMVTIGLL